MKIIIAITLLFYLTSSASYLFYLFRQKEYYQQTGFYALAGGFAFHTAAIGYQYISSGHFPINNMFETLSLAGWAIAGVFLVFQYKFKLKVLGVIAAPLAALVMAVAYFLPQEPVEHNQLLKGFWLVGHVITIFIGEAALALACGAGFLYLVQERAIKTKKPGFFFRRLPSLELLDATGYGCLVTGFTMLTVGLITGVVYAKAVWGHFWSWDPKEVWSAITWLIYAALLHLRLTIGWRGRRAAIMAIIGFGAVLFTFLGVNFLLQGHHGEFTRW